MGNLATKAAKEGRKLKPYKINEIDELNKIAEREQTRLRDVASLQDINEKDEDLGQLLNKLGGSIHEKKVSISQSKNEENIPSDQAMLKKRLINLKANDETGRVQVSVIKEALEQRTINEIKVKPVDYTYLKYAYGVDPDKLETLAKYACLPVIARVNTVTHEYAFARMPLWYRGETSGQRYLSEPPKPQVSIDIKSQVISSDSPKATPSISDIDEVPETNDATKKNIDLVTAKAFAKKILSANVASPSISASQTSQESQNKSSEGPRSFQQMFGSKEMVEQGKRGGSRLSDKMNSRLKDALEKGEANRHK
uniref:Uncharacterized protein n=1 Tax=Polytomella parva TaxID=51329 RepID=A0A7S0YK07_9CHLO|mmetsp:Transcript_30408/g.55546  ORF Transcript_30408/g.55546 Transcript_30408/m.55546 type:complete len:311 (+) Transcript_30408:25-957(+)